MQLGARTFSIERAKNNEYRFNFLQVILLEDKTVDNVLGHGVETFGDSEHLPGPHSLP